MKKNPIHEVYMKNNINDFLEFGEVIVPINQYAKEGYVFQPYYYVTNYAKVFSFRNGKWYQRTDFTNNGGYRSLKLRTTDGQSVEILIHRLVMASFFPFDKMYEHDVDHMYGNRADDELTHLQWMEHAPNVQASYDRGNAECLGDEKIIEIHRRIREAFPKNIDDALAKEYNVSTGTIINIRLGNENYADNLKKLGLEPILYKHGGLSDNSIIEIFKSINDAFPKNIDKELGEKYGVSRVTILNLRTGSGKIMEKLNRLGLKPVTYPRATNNDDIYNIIKLSKEGVSDNEIARLLNKNVGTVIAIRCGKGYYASILEELGLEPIRKRSSNVISNDIITTIMTKVSEAYPKNIDQALSNELGLPMNTIVAVRSGLHGYVNRLEALGFEPIIYKSTVEITDDTIRTVFKMIKDGYSDQKIANKLEIAYLTVRNIRVGCGSYTDRLKKLGIEPVLRR